MKHLLFFIWLFICSIVVFSQDMVIQIWNEELPNSINDASYIEQSDTINNWTKIRYVSNPRIDCYFADSGKANGSAVVIFPGGGYGVLAAGHEGVDVAKWFNTMGISAFVVKYRLPNDKIMKDKSIGPLQDAQEAIRIIRRNSINWNVNPNKIGVIGFSAGGHLASSISTHYNDYIYNVVDTISARPDFSILIYPVVSMNMAITHKGSRINLIGEMPSEELITYFSNEQQVNENTPPAFIVHSMNDAVVPVQNSINYALALEKYKLPCELHLYQKGGHGYGMGRSDNTESTWPETCKKWLKMMGVL